MPYSRNDQAFAHHLRVGVVLALYVASSMGAQVFRLHIVWRQHALLQNVALFGKKGLITSLYGDIFIP